MRLGDLMVFGVDELARHQSPRCAAWIDGGYLQHDVAEKISRGVGSVDRGTGKPQPTDPNANVAPTS